MGNGMMMMVQEKPQSKGRGRVKRVNAKLMCPPTTARISLNVLLQLFSREEESPEERAEHLQAMINWCEIRGIEHYWHNPALFPWDSRQSLYLVVADTSTAAKVRKQCIRAESRYHLVVKRVHDLPPSVIAMREAAIRAYQAQERVDEEC